jgi:hypothetical protein
MLEQKQMINTIWAQKLNSRSVGFRLFEVKSWGLRLKNRSMLVLISDCAAQTTV